MYDLVFMTHLPSFYKVNLYNELSKKIRIMVIFIGHGSSIRTGDFVSKEMAFDHAYLSSDSFEKRNVLSSTLELVRLLLKIRYRRIIVGGWDQLEFWIPLIFGCKSKNALALESTIHESSNSGIKGTLKRFFLTRISFVYSSGILHSKLLEKLGYHRRIIVTKGVGLINPPVGIPPIKKYERKFLYLGRLSSEKNLPFLIKAFQSLPDHQLTIVGSGPEENGLKSVAPTNVHFIPHVDNSGIGVLFEKNDFLILGSTSETWGLVVEESLAHGRPVLISDKCGASELIDGTNGMQFDPASMDSLIQVIRSIDDEKFLGYQQAIRSSKQKSEYLDSFLTSLD
jgi:glycosyltransferase involved in cell wall biosynthesis